MKLTDRRYNNQVFKNTSFSNSGIEVWWTKKKFNGCQFVNCDFNDVVVRGCLFKDCVFQSGKMQHMEKPGRRDPRGRRPLDHGKFFNFDPQGILADGVIFISAYYFLEALILRTLSPVSSI